MTQRIKKNMCAVHISFCDELDVVGPWNIFFIDVIDFL